MRVTKPRSPPVAQTLLDGGVDSSRGRRSKGAVHPWRAHVRSVVASAVALIALFAALFSIYALRAILLLIILAIFFAYLIAPLVELACKLFFRKSRTLAIIAVYALLLLIGAGASALLAPALGRQLGELAANTPERVRWGHERLHALKEWVQIDRLPEAIQVALHDASAGVLDAAGAWLLIALEALTSWVRFVPWLFLVPIIGFFLLRDAASFRQLALDTFPRGRTRWRGADFFDEVNRALVSYVRAQLLGCVLIAVAASVGFLIIGVPYALLFAALAGLLEFIPLVGPVLAAVSAIGAAATSSISQAALTLVFLIVLRLVYDYVVYPRLIGREIKLHPLAIILGILCGAELAGIAGPFLAIPVIAVLSSAYRFAKLQLKTPAFDDPSVANPIAILPSEPTSPAAPSLAGLRILILDDELDAREMLVVAMEQLGASARAAESVSEALTLLPQYRPDVMISDLEMPVEDGFDLIRRLRSLPKTEGGAIPAVALSGYSTLEDRERALEAGFQAHVGKPVSYEDLARTIAALVSKTAH